MRFGYLLSINYLQKFIFRHIAHVGWNGASVLFDKKMTDDPTVRKICDAAAEAVDLSVSNFLEN